MDDLLPIPLKQGDTFLLTCDLVVDGVRQNIATATIAAQVRTRAGALAFPCTVEKVPEEGGTFVFTVTGAPADTAKAPLGILETDIRYTWPDGRVAQDRAGCAAPRPGDDGITRCAAELCRRAAFE